MRTLEGLADLFLGCANFLGFSAFRGFWWLLGSANCGLLCGLFSSCLKPAGSGAISDFWHFWGSGGFWVPADGFGLTSGSILSFFRWFWRVSYGIRPAIHITFFALLATPCAEIPRKRLGRQKREGKSGQLLGTGSIGGGGEKWTRHLATRSRLPIGIRRGGRENHGA